MNLDDLTIGDAKRLVAMLGGQVAPASATVSPFAAMVGKRCLVRSRGSGVWAGSVSSAHEGPAGHTLTLTAARRLWSWSGAAECSAIAERGIEGGKIGCLSAPIVAEVLEVHELSVTADATISRQPEWLK